MKRKVFYYDMILLFILFFIIIIYTIPNDYNVDRRNIAREDKIKHIELNIKSFTPEEKQESINWMIQNDIPSDVLIDEEIPEEIFKKSVENGSIDIIKRLDELFNLKDELDVLNTYIGDNFGLPSHLNILRWGCSYGHLNVVEWMIENFDIKEKDIRDSETNCFSYACGSGNIKLTEYLKERFDLGIGDVTRGGNSCLILASMYGHLDMIKWLIENFNLSRKDIFGDDYEIFDVSCGCGFFDIIKYLAETYILKGNEVKTRNYSSFKGILNKPNSVSMVSWYIEFFMLSSSVIKSLLKSIFGTGTIDVIIYISNKYKISKKDITEEIIEECIIEDRDDVLSYIHNKIFSLTQLMAENDSFLYKKARSHNSEKCAGWMVKNFKVI